MKTTLKNVESRVPELTLVQSHEDKNSVLGFYVLSTRQAEETESGKPKDLQVTITSYESEDAAKRGLELSLRMRAVAPDQKETVKSLTLYRWSGDTILARVGSYVVDVSTLKPSAQPLAMKMYDAVVRELDLPKKEKIQRDPSKNQTYIKYNKHCAKYIEGRISRPILLDFQRESRRLTGMVLASIRKCVDRTSTAATRKDYR